MKNMCSPYVLSLAACFAFAITFIAPKSHAQPVWDATYTGNQLYSPGGGYNANAWYQPSSTYTSAGVGTITYGPGAAANYSAQFSTRVGALWQPTGIAGTVEATFAINSADLSGAVVPYISGINLRLGNDLTYTIAFNQTTVYHTEGGATQAVSLALNTTHTFTLAYDASGLDVYLDGVALSNLQNLSGTGSSVPDKTINFGTLSNGWAINSGTTYSEINWNNSTYYAPVPEPASVALLSMGMAFGIFIGYRKHRRTA